jgi:hypothetical protein
LRAVSSTIVVLLVAGAVTALFVPLRVAVAKQRRTIETVRVRLNAAKVRRSAKGVAVEAIQRVGNSMGHVSRAATCALADDGFYALSDDGRWGARVRFAPGPAEIGDEVLEAAPCLVKGRAAVAPGRLPDWLLPKLEALPPDGLLLQFEGGLSWFAAVPDPDDWFAALAPLARPPGAATT